MDLTTLFIRRPVMTTLVMIAILVFGVVAYQQLPVSDLPNVDFPTITVSATLPGTRAADDGGDGGDAAREVVLDHRRHRQHDVDVEPRAVADRRAVRARPEHRRGGAGRPGGDRPDAAAAAAGHHPAVVPEDQPRRRADPHAGAHVRSRCRSPRSTSIGETTIAQRLSMVGGVAQVLVYGAQKYAVRLQLDPAPARLARHRARGRGDGGHEPERQPADRRAVGAEDGAHDPGDAASSTTPARSATSSSPTATARPVHLSDVGQRHRRRAEQQDGELVQRRARRSSSPSSASRARTRWTWRTR